MISKNNLLSSVAVVALLAASGAAQAAITVHTSQASFLAAVSAAGTDSFDDLSLAGTIAGPLARMAGSHSYSASVGPGSSSFYPAADGAVDIWLASNNRQDTITASGFSSGVSAVGGYFFGSNNVGLSTPATEITVRATDAGGTTTELLLNPGTATFRGFVSTGGLTSLTLWVGANQGVGEVDVFPTLNDLTLAVPEPQSYALMLGGLALLGWAARPNKRG